MDMPDKKKWKSRVVILLAVAAAGSLAVPAARTQTSGGLSNFIFRFNTGISAVFLDTMTFASESPLDLGACTATEKINGPLSCLVNCDGDSVCLLELSGPSGSDVNDVMEKASEIPLPASSPSPGASPSPAGAESFGNLAGMGTWHEGVGGREGRVNAYQ